MPGAKIIGKHHGHEEKRARHGIQARRAAFHADGRKHHIDDRICGENQMRLELADDDAATEPAKHEESEANQSQPVRGFFRRHGGIVSNRVVHTETEYARLRRDVDELRADAERKMFSP
jgi:hypothetical protein